MDGIMCNHKPKNKKDQKVEKRKPKYKKDQKV